MLATLEPVRLSSLWHREPRPEDDHEQRLQAAIVGAMDLLEEAWTRNLPHCELDTYEPREVARLLRGWSELVSSAYGMSSAGAEPIVGRGEPDARRTIISIKADLEQGTDEGLYTILHWQAAAKIYRRQGRTTRYFQRRAKFMATFRDTLTREPNDAALAEAVCIERISRSLRWYPHNCAEQNA